MFPCQFHISGHSGTDVKHKKPFVKLKEYYKNNPDYPSNATEKSVIAKYENLITTRTESKVNRLILFFVKIPLAIMMLGGVVIGSVHFYKLSKNIQVSKKRRRSVKAEIFMIESYDFLVKSGYYELSRGDMKKAQAEFIRALNIKKMGLEAVVGLTEVLKKRCENESMYCHKYMEYQEYLEKVTYQQSKTSKSLPYLIDSNG